MIKPKKILRIILKGICIGYNIILCCKKGGQVTKPKNIHYKGINTVSVINNLDGILE